MNGITITEADLDELTDKVEPIMESLKVKRVYADNMFNALIDKVGKKIKSHA